MGRVWIYHVRRHCVSNFHPALQLTSTISELELPFPSILHHTSLHPDHCKLEISCSQFLTPRICSSDHSFMARATEMKEYFRSCGYPETLLNNDLLYKGSQMLHMTQHNTTDPECCHTSKSPAGTDVQSIQYRSHSVTLTSCPWIVRHVGFSLNSNLFHINMTETSGISLCTPMMVCPHPLKPDTCPADIPGPRCTGT